MAFWGGVFSFHEALGLFHGGQEGPFLPAFFLESELWEMARKWEGEIAFRSGRDHLGR